MKLLRELTIEDFVFARVWRSAGGPDESAVVEPTDRASLTETESETFLAATTFVLGNGQHVVGFCSPVDDSGLDYVQPVIITPQGHVRLWFDELPTPDVLAGQWSKLGIAESKVFPIAFECLVPVDGRLVRGTVHALANMGN